MAKITVEFDTVTKLATAMIDGKSVDNFSNMSIYPCYSRDDDGPSFCCSLQSAVDDKDQKLSRVETVYASDKSDVQTEMKNFFSGSLPR